MEDPDAAKVADTRWEIGQAHDLADLQAQQRSADAAENQVWISFAAAAFSLIAVVVAILSSRSAARAYEQAERAWIGVAGVNFKEERDLNGAKDVPAPRLIAVEVHPTLRNFGNSPALECRVYADLKFLDQPEQEDPPLFTWPSDVEWGKRAMPLMPGAEAFPSRVVIPLERLLQMRDNTTLRAFLYVRAEYKDVLRRKKRMTESCHEVVIIRWIANPEILDRPIEVKIRCRQFGPQNSAT